MKSVYIHIPFCNNICTYCDFCKLYYKKEWVDKYLDALELEIKENYKGEIIETLYIGGGTPSSLSLDELKKLFEILKTIKLSDSYEYTIECNPDSMNNDKILLMKEYGINRVSLGVETFNAKYLKLLNRKSSDVNNIISMLKDNKITNINVDLMYALPGETMEELKDDIKKILELDVPHISTYSLIIEPNTKLYIDKVENIDEDLDYEMYTEIINSLSKYNHYEVSNFGKSGYESKHNLTYWNNEHYYGFGLGASGYIDNVRYENTRSLNNYLKGNYVLNKEELDIDVIKENELILGFRKLEGISIEKYKEKYNEDILENEVVKQLLTKGKLINKDGFIRIDPKYTYTSNEILINFLN